MTVEHKVQRSVEQSGNIDPIPWYNLALPFSERRVLLFAGDVFMLGLAVLASLATQTLLQNQPLSSLGSRTEQTPWLLALMALWLVLATVNDCYDLKLAHHHRRTAHAVFITGIQVSVGFLIVFFFFGRPIDFTTVATMQEHMYVPLPRISSAVFLLFALLLILVWRQTYLRLFKHVAILRQRAVIIGSSEPARALARAVTQDAQDYEIVGFIEDGTAINAEQIEDLPVLGNYSDLLHHLRTVRANEVILAMDDLHADLFAALMDCYERGIMVKPIALVYEEMLGRIPVEHLREEWFPIPPWETTNTVSIYSAFKRLMDIVVALIGLICTAPLFPLVALALYIDSPGPVFYTQERVGRGGRRFRIIKLRSMIPNAEQEGGARWATQDDPRITTVGKILRRTRLDEVPQLINVLTGEMSIVGPRPERSEFVSQLEQQVPFYRARLRVKPGLTGLAQIRYHYGNSTEDALHKLQYDLYYIKHQSLWLDILIILRTVRVVLSFSGT